MNIIIFYFYFTFHIRNVGHHLTQRMKNHPITIALKYTKVAHFQKVAQSFVFKIQNKLERDPVLAVKSKTNAQGSNTIRTYNLLKIKRKLQEINQHHCKIRQCFRMHHLKRCIWVHPVQTVCDSEGSVYVGYDKRQSFDPFKALGKQVKMRKSQSTSEKKKNFNQDQSVNWRNNRWSCSDPNKFPTYIHTKFPENVMVLGDASPHFFS